MVTLEQLNEDVDIDIDIHVILIDLFDFCHLITDVYNGQLTNDSAVFNFSSTQFMSSPL